MHLTIEYIYIRGNHPKCTRSCRIDPIRFLAGWRRRRLKQALVSLRLVLCKLGFCSFCLGYCVVTWFTSTVKVIGWQDWVFALVERSAAKIGSEMTVMCQMKRRMLRTFGVSGLI